MGSHVAWRWGDSSAGDPATRRGVLSRDYLIVYLLRDDAVYLLAIKHHRQLSFDLMGHWP